MTSSSQMKSQTQKAKYEGLPRSTQKHLQFKLTFSFKKKREKGEVEVEREKGGKEEGRKERRKEGKGKRKEKKKKKEFPMQHMAEGRQGATMPDGWGGSPCLGPPAAPAGALGVIPTSNEKPEGQEAGVFTDLQQHQQGGSRQLWPTKDSE